MVRFQILSRQHEILEAARTAGRDLTDEERTEFDGLQRQLEQLTQEPATPQPAQDPAGEAQRAVEAERTRVSEITGLARSFGLDPEQAIGDGITMDAYRAQVLEHLRQNGAPVPTRGVEVTADEGDKFRAAATDSLIMRSGMRLDAPAEGSREMMGMHFRDLAVECLRMDGVGDASLTRKSSDDLYTMLARGFYNPESAFPAILDNTIEKAYKEGYRKVPVTFDRYTKTGTLSDFKIHDNYYIAGPVGEFLEVPEGGELKHDVFGDAKLPTRQLKTYGRQFTLTRKAFIDDDIGLVTSVPARYAASARKTINRQVIDILMDNPAIYDGVPLFHSTHKNLLATGTAVTSDAVQTMIMAMATQLDQFGEAIIINPAVILVPAGMAFDIYTLFNSPTINTAGNTQAVNPLYQYRSSIEIVEDPTINAKAGGMGNVMPWYMFGAQADVDGIEVDYLNGQEIPTIRRMEAPGQLGFIWDIYLDWGISVMDYRGIVKNPGVTVNTKLSLA